MKRGIRFLEAVILVLAVIIGGAACMANPEESSLSSPSGAQSQVSSPTKSTESAIYSDKQIVEAVFADYYKYSKADEIADSAAGAMRRAEELSNRYLGGITSEEDAKKKAEAVWTEIDSGVLEYTKEIFERLNQPYIEAVFYEKYDVWVARTCTSGTTEDGESFALTGLFEIVIRKSDGKVLAVRC